MTRLPLLVAAAWLGLHLLHDLTGVGGPSVTAFEQQWFQPLTFLACGLAVLVRARVVPRRARWRGRCSASASSSTATGSVVYDLVSTTAAPPFPSPADGLWLSLYPLVFAAIVLLVRQPLRPRRPAGVWLDGLIGGAVVAAVAAALLLQPVFDVAVDGRRWPSVARLAYPLGDLVSVGVHRRRLEPQRPAPRRVLGLLGRGLRAARRSPTASTSSRPRAAAGRPAASLDLPYALATMLLAAAAWAAPAGRAAGRAGRAARTVLPVGFALAAVALMAATARRRDARTRSRAALATLDAARRRRARFGLTLDLADPPAAATSPRRRRPTR